MDKDIDLIRKLLDNKELVCARQDYQEVQEGNDNGCMPGVSADFEDDLAFKRASEFNHRYLLPLVASSFFQLTNSVGKSVTVKSDADWIPVTQGEVLIVDTGVILTLPDGLVAVAYTSDDINESMIHSNSGHPFLSGESIRIYLTNVKKNVSIIKKGDIIGYAYVVHASPFSINKKNNEPCSD